MWPIASSRLADPTSSLSLPLALLLTTLLPGASADAPLLTDYAGYNSEAYGAAPSQTFRSSPLVIPRLQVNAWDKQLVDQTPYLFLGLWSPLGGNAGPYIYSTKDLSLIYAEQRWPSAHNTHVQRYCGQDFLVFYQGEQRDGHSSGTCIFLDHAYNIVHSVEASGRPAASVDMHECQVTEEGTVLITIYESRDMDTSSAGGLTLAQGGKLLESVFQEIDIATGELVFEWRASDHYNLQDSYYTWDYDKPEGWDFFHINSIDKTSEGHYLVSARHTHTISYINGTSGDIIWTLGGNATDFAWQHHARFRGKRDGCDQLTFFDNHNLDTAVNGPGCSDTDTTSCSRGRHLEICTGAMTASLVQDFLHPSKLVSGAMGGYEIMPNNNVLLGWGVNPAVTEHTPDGKAVLDIQYNIWKPDSQGRGHYRAFKSEWSGRPSWPPAMAWEAVPEQKGASRLFLSWNGATDIASWQILAGNTTSTLDVPSQLFPRAGFETTVTVTPGVQFGQAVALDMNGSILGMTSIINLQTGSVQPQPQVQL